MFLDKRFPNIVKSNVLSRQWSEFLILATCPRHLQETVVHLVNLFTPRIAVEHQRFLLVFTRIFFPYSSKVPMPAVYIAVMGVYITLIFKLNGSSVCVSVTKICIRQLHNVVPFPYFMSCKNKCFGPSKFSPCCLYIYYTKKN